VGIAAALLLAASVLFVASRTPRPGVQTSHRGADIKPAHPPSRPADLSGELAEARKQASDARDTLAEAMVQIRADDLKIKELGQQLATQDDQLVQERDKWTGRELELTLKIGMAEQSEINAKGELQKAQKELADAKSAGIKTPADVEELKGLKVRLAVAVKELKRQQDTFRAANAERDKANEALAVLKARHHGTLDQIRRVYLAAAAPGKTGLAALQEAMKRRGLLRRCVALQRKARAEADKKLLGRAEVALTRLGLLDLSDPSAVSAYVTGIGKGDLIASLDAALGPLATDAGTQDWLFEAKLILTGVQRVI
jgi:hypothetical protein